MKFLIIQTAFIGDAILATALLETIHKQFPEATIDFLIRKGNESLFAEHPYINKLYVWNKKPNKYKTVLQLLKQVRKEKYDQLINLQRFATMGWFTAFSGAKTKVGFSKNPFSFGFDIKVEHLLSENLHEIDRNQMLIAHLSDRKTEKPKLYPTLKHFEEVKKYQNKEYICIAPTSVWFTKQFPASQWIKFLKEIPQNIEKYYLGAPTDFEACEEIRKNTGGTNLAGKLNLLQSAALMKLSKLNCVNDSAPMHISSAMNAPTLAIYCSTVPEFGFYPLSDKSTVVQTKEKLACRPCNLHGKKSCPKAHFKCAFDIDIAELVSAFLSEK